MFSWLVADNKIYYTLVENYGLTSKGKEQTPGVEGRTIGHKKGKTKVVSILISKQP